MTERRCPGCGEFYLKKEGACPMCGYPPAKFNKPLYTAKVNDGLYKQIEHAEANA